MTNPQDYEYHFNEGILTREDVRLATINNKYANNIMRYIDLLLNGCKESDRALELACEAIDYDDCPVGCECVEGGGEDCKDTVYNYLIKEARQKLKESETK